MNKILGKNKEKTENTQYRTHTNKGDHPSRTISFIKKKQITIFNLQIGE